MRNLIYLFFTCIYLLNVLGCSSNPRLVNGKSPPDFSMVMCSPLIEDDGDMQNKAVFVVEPDGTLRSATGPGCTLNTFPEPTAKLRSDQIQRFYNRLCQIESHLDSKKYDSKDAIGWFRIKAVANGNRFRFDIPITNEDSESEGLLVRMTSDMPFGHAFFLAMDLHVRSGLYKSEPFFDPEFPDAPPGYGNEDSAGPFNPEH